MAWGPQHGLCPPARGGVGGGWGRPVLGVGAASVAPAPTPAGGCFWGPSLTPLGDGHSRPGPLRPRARALRPVPWQGSPSANYMYSRRWDRPGARQGLEGEPARDWARTAAPSVGSTPIGAPTLAARRGWVQPPCQRELRAGSPRGPSGSPQVEGRAGPRGARRISLTPAVRCSWEGWRSAGRGSGQGDWEGGALPRKINK